jgi:hypothetical protein
MSESVAYLRRKWINSFTLFNTLALIFFELYGQKRTVFEPWFNFWRQKQQATHR